MALAGCSSAAKDQPDETLASPSATAVESATAAAATAASAPSEEPETHAAVTHIPPSAAATADLSDVTCSADQAGSWTFEATVNNPGDTPRRYTVAVAVIVNAVVQGHAMIAVEVPAKGTKPVVAKDFATTAEPGAVCEPVMSVED
ncbi:hypothetical protein [Arthrobacter sp. H35-D1]|uniref:hypothetical protein n=1 Tax=Arthrobacter sp. H35-D1 TaxID=3046202 RepID=UPI0024BB6F52|nr:hypothetical protein [Arthrobacter sp. H35-D1]MDJ0312874.1 hypothetical protein [Arthrobacter sp. H35-D1]